MPDVALAPDTSAALLALARDSIAAWLAGLPEPDLKVNGADHHAGAFVSLYLEEKLRGCMGHTDCDRPLARVVRKMAVSAARDDPRFQPLRPIDLEDLGIEISVLTPLVPASAESIVIGRDGVMIRRGARQGLLLPQVAEEWGLDREGFLAMACRKANLPKDAWREDGVRLFVFQAEIIGAPVA
ncbi:MAG TPA: AmmeMemoRadiSam system protein A [Gemmatimonadales bacterium]|jgi:AmmeMemoRadiSam system protein A